MNTYKGNNIVDESEGSDDDSDSTGVLRKPRIRSLSEIMKAFDAWGIAKLLHHIDYLWGYCWKQIDSGQRDVVVTEQEMLTYVFPVIYMAQHHAGKAHLKSTNDRVWENGPFTLDSKLGLTYQQCANELKVLRECVEADLEKLWFAQIEPDKQRIVFNLPLSWKKIWDAIPECKWDTDEAFYCYALERHTAAVFHGMRVAEYGLRFIARQVGVRLTDKGKRQPIEYATWDKVIDGIKRKIEKARQQSHGPKKSKTLQFYSSAAENCTYIRDIWRNEVSHTRGAYNEGEALGVLERVRSFMDLLANQP
jgi:hypothetical protein